MRPNQLPYVPFRDPKVHNSGSGKRYTRLGVNIDFRICRRIYIYIAIDQLPFFTSLFPSLSSCIYTMFSDSSVYLKTARYGKDLVRLLRVYREGQTQRCTELTVCIWLEAISKVENN